MATIKSNLPRLISLPALRAGAAFATLTLAFPIQAAVHGVVPEGGRDVGSRSDASAIGLARIIPPRGEFSSATPQYQFGDTLAEQEAQLAANPLMRRFAESRRALANDRYRPAYHFVSPESSSNDPNGLSFWRGRWHLFYQAHPPDEFPDSKDIHKRRVHWGHAVSDDLIHWRDLPYAIYPDVERQAFSGSIWVEDDRVIAMYPGMGIGRPHPDFPEMPELSSALMVATSSDPLLLNWTKRPPAVLRAEAGFDADIWKQGDTYYGALGTLERYYPEAPVLRPSEGVQPGFLEKIYGIGVWPRWSLIKSKDLTNWEAAGDLLFQNSPFTDRYADGSCPNFQKIADKYIMLFFSHSTGAQYLLGDYDASAAKFRPYEHGRLNHGQVSPGGVHAPSATTDARGDVINILNINAGKPTSGWDQVMSLPQRLSLDAEKRLKIDPIETVASLRGEHHSLEEMVLAANEERVLDQIRGNTLELSVEIDPGDAQQVQVNVLRSPDAQERTSITFFNNARKQNIAVGTKQEIVLDAAESSILTDVTPRPPERAELSKPPMENLKLRIFIDRSVVEVFANGKQYLAMRVYPGRTDSVGVSLKARGGIATLKRLDAWQMKSIWQRASAEKALPNGGSR